MRKSENSTILVSESDNKLVRFLVAIGVGAKRNNHSTYIVIGMSCTTWKIKSGTIFVLHDIILIRNRLHIIR
jgi:hypothetical protein